MRRWQSLWCWLLCSCALPAYHISENTDAVSVEPGAGTETKTTVAPSRNAPTNKMAELAPAECLSCADSECRTQHASCGKDCDSLAWPISPAFVPPEASHGFVKCLANKCDAQCNVLWGCVDAYTWTPPSEAYTVSIGIANAFSGEPDVGARVTACQASDPGCGIGSGMESSYTTDGAGQATLTLEPGFFGYFLIEPHDPKYYPMTMMWSQPTYRLNREFTILLFERVWLDEMAKTLSVPKDDENAGHVIFRAENCLPIEYLGDTDGNAEADDIVVAFSRNGPASSPVFYTRFALSVDPLLKMTKSTGSSYGGALNMLPGALTLVASHEKEDVVHATLRMRTNTLALVHLVPDGR